MTSRSLVPVASLVAACLWVSGCSGEDTGRPSADPSPSTSGADHNDDEHFHQMEPDTATAEQLDPVAAAEKFIHTWSRPEMSYEQWWSDLEPLLNPQGRQSYAYTDPAQIPDLTLEGKPRLEQAQVETSAVVWFNTNHGKFAVRLSRTSGESPWLVARLYFPGSSPTEL